MVKVLSVLLFLVYLYGFGSLILKKESSVLVRLAVGLPAIVVLGVIFDFLHIPLDWRLFLGLALIGPGIQAFQFIKAKGSKAYPRLKSLHWKGLLLFIIFVFALVLYCWGPFQYPWLENDDSWSHAASIKYVAIEKDLKVPQGFFQYLNPYPPGYAVVLGIMHQVNPSLYWTLKFFNGFMICLGFLFFYVFAKDFAQNEKKAVVATFFLILIPCYLTHFIWAHALVISLFFSAFYFLIKAFKEKDSILPASICCAAIFLTQPTQAIKFVIMVVLMVACYRSVRINWKNISRIVLVTTLVSLVWWGPVILRTLDGRSKIVTRDGLNIAGTTSDTRMVAQGLFDPSGGTATRAYTWKDYVFVTRPFLINNPTGLGMVISFLAVLGLMLFIFQLFKGKEQKARKAYLLTVFFWLIFTFLGMNSKTFSLPIGLFAFRFWMLFAIPIAFLCAEVVFWLLDYFNNGGRRALAAIIILGTVAYVSLPFKWVINTGRWSYGVHWVSLLEIDGYVWMRENFPANTKVFTFTDNILVLGHDMRADFWTKDYQSQFQDPLLLSVDELHHSLKDQGFEFLVISQRDVLKYGKEEINRKMVLFVEKGLFYPVFDNTATKIFQISFE